MKIHDLPAHRRPREKLMEKGVGGLTEVELIALLLRTGYKGKSALEVARELSKKHSLLDLSKLALSTLANIKGIGISRATQLQAALALGRLLVQDVALPTVSSPEIMYQLCHSLTTKKQEHLVALYLNARNELISQQTITIGTVNSSLIHPREVFAPALELRAASVILVHNHPSGNTQPSEEDIVASEKILEAGNLLDVPLLDHIIVSSQGWTSLKQEEYI